MSKRHSPLTLNSAYASVINGEARVGGVTPTPPTLASPLMTDAYADFSGRGECPLDKAVVVGGHYTV